MDPATAAAIAQVALRLMPTSSQKLHGMDIRGDAASLLNHFQRDPVGAELRLFKNLAKWGDCSGWGSGCRPHRDSYLAVARAARVPVPAACFTGPGKSAGAARRRVEAGCSPRPPLPAAPVQLTAVSPLIPAFGLMPAGEAAAVDESTEPAVSFNPAAVYCRLTGRCG